MTVTVTSVANDPLHSPATEDTLALPTKTDTHVSLETRIRLDAVAQGIDQNPTFVITQVLQNMKQLVAMVDKVAEVGIFISLWIT
jgi:5,10-methylenetetrahydrofolate reductase